MLTLIRSFLFKSHSDYYYITCNSIDNENKKKVIEKIKEKSKTADLILVPNNEFDDVPGLEDRFIEKWEEGISNNLARVSLNKKHLSESIDNLKTKLKSDKEFPRKKILVLFNYHLQEGLPQLAENREKIQEILKNFKFREITIES